MKKILLICSIVLINCFLFAQTDKKPLELKEVLKWNRITERLISNDGQTIVYKEAPWKGDAVLKISTVKGEEKLSLVGGNKAKITPNSKFVVFTIEAKKEIVRQLKLKKTKKADLPQNELGIFNLKTNETIKIARIKSYKLPTEWDGWIAYQTTPETKKPVKDTTDKKKESPKVKKAKKIKKESAKNGYTLNLKNLETGEVITFPFVSTYILAKDSQSLSFISTGDDKEFKAGVYHYDIANNSQKLLFETKGSTKQLSIKKTGNAVAFVADTTTDKKKDKNYSLYLWNGEGVANEVATKESFTIPEDWEISANGKITFAETTNRVFFGTAPIRPKKDTTVLEEEIPVLDIWVWDENVLQTQQLNNKKRDLKKTYLAVYHTDQYKAVQLETKKFSRISMINKGDANQLLATSNWPYAVQRMWEGSPAHQDFYLVDINTGEAIEFKHDVRATPQASPEGKFIYWYNTMDTTWNTYNIASGIEYKVTNARTVQVANELNDIPNPPRAYGSPAWSKGDETFFVYDRYDIWAISPENTETPINLTINGRKTNTSYRLNRFDQSYRGEQKGIDISETLLLSGHNDITRHDGYYKFSFKKSNKPKELIAGAFKTGRRILKAKNEDVYVYTKEDFQTYPNLIFTDKNFKKATQISDAAPQQDNYLWGTAELVEWVSLDGRKLQGTLHKPANFDPNKKYPMIVNFYEKSSQGLFGYHMPENGRSTIGYHFYTSQGYVIFNPDVYYKTGYPGEDAFNCVMPGVTAMIAKGYIDKDRIGAQGHSWGGYQVAYLATRTNLFAAIESGAPVVNMFSAYGGIRWGSGMNRSFQYEHTQSRIGKSIWESPLRYIENSPIFTMDKVNTPILIMHNDKDGAVPWYQGIEYFIALRRLGKPAWLLNYNQADHWPLKVRDKHDFQIRLKQFFDHYLKGAPMPIWMKEGVPAINKGFEMGYELEN